jgi:hypothetical protein
MKYRRRKYGAKMHKSCVLEREKETLGMTHSLCLRGTGYRKPKHMIHYSSLLSHAFQNVKHQLLGMRHAACGMLSKISANTAVATFKVNM